MERLRNVFSPCFLALGVFTAARADTPSAADLDKLVLQAPLRMEYTYVGEDQMSPADRNAETERQIARDAEHMKNSGVPQETIDRQATMRRRFASQQKGPIKFTITFATDGTSFVYTQKPTGVTGDAITGLNPGLVTTLCDGKQTISIVQNGHQMIIRPGIAVTEIRYLPLPGVGLPGMPLFRSSEMGDEGDKYIPEGCLPVAASFPFGVSKKPNEKFGVAQGSAKVTSVGGQLQVAQVNSQRLPLSWFEWDFSNFNKFQGLWAAKDVSLTRRVIDDKFKGTSKLDYRETFHIDKLSDAKIDPKTVDYHTYLADADVIVLDFRNGPSPIAYHYDPKLTLDQMLEQHKNDTPGVIRSGPF